jgi:hypothetical protein
LWNAKDVCAFVLRLSADNAMTQPVPTSLDSSGSDPLRLIAEHRERIIALEAHGLPPEQGEGLWDVMSDILAEMKRQQELMGSHKP